MQDQELHDKLESILKSGNTMTSVAVKESIEALYDRCHHEKRPEEPSSHPDPADP